MIKLNTNYKNKIKSSIFGAIIGDALGTPVLYNDYNHIDIFSVEKMNNYVVKNLNTNNIEIKSGGMWSNNSSMLLSTLESLMFGYDINMLAKNLCKWYDGLTWIPKDALYESGFVFDNAIDELKKGDYSGMCNINDDSNTSIIRLLPLLFILYKYDVDERHKAIKEVCSLINPNMTCVIASDIFLTFAFKLLDGENKKNAFIFMQKEIIEYYEDEFSDDLIQFYNVVYMGNLSSNSNMILHPNATETIELVLKFFLNCSSYKETVLSTISYGGDTNTLASLVGGLSGLYYGFNQIPENWTNKIYKKDKIDKLCNKYYRFLKNF